MKLNSSLPLCEQANRPQGSELINSSVLMLIWYSARPTSHFLVFWMIIYPKISAVCFLGEFVPLDYEPS